MENVTFKYGIFEVTLSQKDIEQIYSDLLFFQDATLNIINPELCRKSWDFACEPEEYKTFLYQFYMDRENNWNKDFINKVFS